MDTVSYTFVGCFLFIYLFFLSNDSDAKVSCSTAQDASIVLGLEHCAAAKGSKNLEEPHLGVALFLICIFCNFLFVILFVYELIIDK